MKKTRFNIAFLTIVFIIAMLTGISLVYPSPWAIQTPGTAFDLSREINGHKIVSVTGTTVYPEVSHLSMTTVSLYGQPETGVPAIQTVAGWINKNDQVVPQDYVFPKNATNEQVRKQGVQEMSSSQNNATTAAIEYLGHKVPMEIIVAGLQDYSLAKGKLEPGDQITSLTINGNTYLAPSYSEVRKELAKTQPGVMVTLGVKRKDKTFTVSFPTTASKEVKGAVMGIVLGTKIHPKIDVRILIENVGGPSAGLMFTLAIIDLLTPGKLAGDTRVAGTGTMTMLGEVGPIGGIVQKMIGAKAAGNTVFLAPGLNCSEVVDHEPAGMQVYAVDNLSEAVAVLQALARHETPNAPNCKAYIAKQEAKHSNNRLR